MGTSTKDHPADDSSRDLVEAAAREADALASVCKDQLPAADEIPGFEITAELGRGGMGVVYEAIQLSTKRPVALKVMLTSNLASSPTHKRFQREIEWAARLQHPNIVRVLESGQTRTGQPFYAMDLIHGTSLDGWRTTRNPDDCLVTQVFRQICAALRHAHEADIVHRDLKPANILIDEQDVPHVLDFGLAKALAPPNSTDKVPTTLSGPGRVVGTLRYLSPEQADGSSACVDQRTDVYALGILLFEVLTGTVPFSNEEDPSLCMRRIREDQPPRPSRIVPRINRDLEAIVLMAIEKHPSDRYQSAADFADDLLRYEQGQPVLARSPSAFYWARKRLAAHRRAIATAALATALGLGGWWIGATWYGQRAEQQRAREQALHEHNLRQARHKLIHAQDVMEAGQLRRVRAIIETLALQYPELPEAWLMLAQLRFRDGQAQGNTELMAEGPTIFRQLRDYPGVPGADNNLVAEMYTILRIPDMAQNCARFAAAHPPETADDWYVWSYATLDADQAARWAAQATTRDPTNMLAWERLARVCARHDAYADARIAIAQLIEHAPQPARWIAFDAEIRCRQGDFAAAIEQFTHAAQYAEANFRAYRGRGIAYLCQRNYTAAIADFTRAAELANGDAIWERYFCATPWWITGDIESAAQAYRSVRGQRGAASYASARLFILLTEASQQYADQGREEDAQAALAEANEVLAAARVVAANDTNMRMIFNCLGAPHTAHELVATLEDATKEQQCAGYYYAAEAAAMSGERQQARDWFQKTVETHLMFDPSAPTFDPMNEWHLALWRLEQLPE